MPRAVPSAALIKLDVHPLTRERWDDLTTLFGEGGDPKWCWCMYWRLRARDFSLSSAAANREGLQALADADPAPGLVAYSDGRLVGWVGLGPRSDFERLERSKLLPRLDDRPAWSIVCFVVSRRARGRGVARALLAAAVEYARAHGAPAIEAYPAATEGRRIASAAAYTGTASMFAAAGFGQVRPSESVTGGVPRVIVRLEL